MIALHYWSWFYEPNTAESSIGQLNKTVDCSNILNEKQTKLKNGHWGLQNFKK